MRDIFFGGVLVLSWAVQAALAAAWALRSLPGQEIFAWFTFVVAVAAGTIGVRKKFPAAYIANEALISFLALSAGFQMLVYAQRPQLASAAFAGVMLYALVYKLAHRRIHAAAGALWGFVWDEANRPLLRRVFTWGFAAWIAAVLYVPDMKAVEARDFLGQQFHHLDSFIAGPAFAASHGGRLNVDHTSYYGLGMPVEAALICQLWGGVSYERFLIILMWAGISYYIVLFLLLCRWLQSPLLAAGCVVLAMRAQVFQTGVVPIVWTTPQGSPMRFWWDAGVFWMVFLHLKTLRLRYVCAAAALCGVAVWHVSSTGMSLAAAFAAYLAFCVWNPHYRGFLIKKPLDWLRLAAIGALTPLIALALLWWSVGPALFSKEFLENSGEFMKFFLSCEGTGPLSDHIKNKNFIFLAVGLLLPCVYVWTMTYIGSLCRRNLVSRMHLLSALWALYGLGLYEYFVVVSSNYYAAGLPFFVVLYFWLVRILERAAAPWRRALMAAALIVPLYCMMTSHMFAAYPNAFNASRSPMVDPKVAQLLDNRLYYFNQLFIQYPNAFKLPQNSLGETDEDLRVEKDFSSDEQLKSYYRQVSDFSRDAALISSLVPAGEKAAVVSSFEIPMLMQAQRRPFFYYLPLINSRPLRMRIFVTTHMFTKLRLHKTVEQLETDKTPFIFMERIFLNRTVPRAYYWDSIDMMEFLSYIFDKYQPYQTGEFLVAMKRKDTGDSP